MKDMRELKSFLGIDITHNKKEHTIMLSQKEYIDTINRLFNGIKLEYLQVISDTDVHLYGVR